MGCRFIEMCLSAFDEIVPKSENNQNSSNRNTEHRLVADRVVDLTIHDEISDRRSTENRDTPSEELSFAHSNSTSLVPPYGATNNEENFSIHSYEESSQVAVSQADSKASGDVDNASSPDLDKKEPTPLKAADCSHLMASHQARFPDGVPEQFSLSALAKQFWIEPQLIEFSPEQQELLHAALLYLGTRDEGGKLRYDADLDCDDCAWTGINGGRPEGVDAAIVLFKLGLADVNDRDADACTALERVMTWNDLPNQTWSDVPQVAREVRMQKLLDAGADPNLIFSDGTRPLCHVTCEEDYHLLHTQYGAASEFSYEMESPQPGTTTRVLFNKHQRRIGGNQDTTALTTRFTALSGTATALHWATDGRAVRVLSSEGRIDVDAKNDQNLTPLMVAAKEGRLDAVKELLVRFKEIASARAAGSSTAKDAVTGDSQAAKAVETMASKYLCELLDWQDEDGKSALHHAASGGHPNSAEIVRLLLEAGANAGLETKLEELPIHFAEDSLTIIHLRNAGNDVNQKDAYGRSPLARASVRGNTEALEELHAQGASIPGSGALHVAKNGKTVRVLIGKLGADPNEKLAEGFAKYCTGSVPRKGETPLDVIVRCRSSMSAAVALLDAGAQSRAVNTGSNRFAWNCRLFSGAIKPDIFVRSTSAYTEGQGHTLLDRLLTSSGGFELLTDLIEQGKVDVHGTDWQGWNILDRAVRYACPLEYIEKIVEFVGEASLNQYRGQRGIPVLNQAALYANECNPELFDFLIQKGADVEAKFRGKTALEMACDQKGVPSEVILAFIRNGASPLPIMKGHFHELKLLIDANLIDLRQQDSSGRNLLYQAVKAGCSIEQIKYLRDKMGDSAHCGNMHGQTPLEAELKYRGDLEIAKYLYESGGKEMVAHKDIMDAAFHGYLKFRNEEVYSHFKNLAPKTE